MIRSNRKVSWIYLAWNDIKNRYRRTYVGPLWIVLSTAFSIGCLSLFYSEIFNVNIKEFIPFVAGGIVVWGFISSSMNECCNVLVSYRFLLLNIKIEPELLVVRTVSRNFFVFLHNMIIMLLVIFLMGINLSLETVLLFVPGVLLTVLFCYYLGVILAYVCARFSDVGQIIISLLNVAFLVTPIIWKKEFLGNRSYLVDFNPFAHFLSIVRDPLLGIVPMTSSWIVCIVVVGALCAISKQMSRYFSKAIVHWI